jgi:hypothetical protein
MQHPDQIRSVPEIRLFNRATIAAAVLAAGIFVFDMVVPRGTNVGVLYVLPLLVATLSGPPRFQFVAAAVATGLAVLALILSPASVTAPFAIVNRAIAVAVIWATANQGARRRQLCARPVGDRRDHRYERPDYLRQPEVL